MSLPHIQVIRRAGKVYLYARPPGLPRVSLPDRDDPGFLEAYLHATKGAESRRRKPAPLGSLVGMIEAFRQSARFLALSPDYRRVIRRHLADIEDQAEDALAAHLKAAHVRADLAPLSPHVAAARLKAWRLLCCFGAEAGLIAADVSEGIRRKKLPKSEGHLPWEPDQIEAYRTRWPIETPQRKAMELVYWTAARIGDAVLLGPGMVGRDGVLAFRQSKTGEEAYVPWTCPLPRYAAHMQRDRDLMHETLGKVRQMTFLATAQGRTRSKQGLGNLIAEAARDAGVNRSAHGLRKSLCISLAEGGASSHDGSSWSGHVTLDEWEHYIALANRRKAVRGEEQEQNLVNRSTHL